MGDHPDFCWICGSKWTRNSYNSWVLSRWVFSDGPFGYGICIDCTPYWNVALPIAKLLFEDTAWPSDKMGQGLCIICKTTTYEERSLYNHPRCLGIGRNYMLCGDCRGIVDEVRHAAIEARKATGSV